MNGLTLNGLWCLELQFAQRMHGLIQPRVAAGLDPVSASFMAPHPATKLPADSQVLMAGSQSYYDYVAERYTTQGVCVVPIQGTLSRYGYCGWGYEDLSNLMVSADNMDTVQAHLLKMDTPGGAVDGLKAFAETVRSLTKPVVVWTNFAASAGYFIASQATEIWIENQTLPVVGSVGTLMVYQDVSQALEKAGIQVTYFRAKGSTDKALLNGVEPLSDETRAEIQSLLDAAQSEFVGYVRRGRAGLLKSDEWTTGKMYGVKDALRIGLADYAGTFQQAIKRAIQLTKN